MVGDTEGVAVFGVIDGLDVVGLIDGLAVVGETEGVAVVVMGNSVGGCVGTSVGDADVG